MLTCEPCALVWRDEGDGTQSAAIIGRERLTFSVERFLSAGGGWVSAEAELAALSVVWAKALAGGETAGRRASRAGIKHARPGASCAFW